MIILIGRAQSSNSELSKISFRGFFKGHPITHILLRASPISVEPGHLYLLKILEEKIKDKTLYGKILSIYPLRDFDD